VTIDEAATSPLRASARCALLVGCFAAAVTRQTAAAQSPTRFTLVTLADSFTVLIALGANGGGLTTRTPEGVFYLRADSAALSGLVKATAALPAPKPPAAGAQPAFAATLLRASDESGNAIQIIRVSDDTLPIYNVGVTNGTWEFARRLSPESGQLLLTALCGGSGRGIEWKVAKAVAPSVDRSMQAAEMTSDSPGPSYPARAELNGLSGEVQAEFVVGVDGKARRESLLIVKSTHPLFALAVRDVLPRMRFIPENRNGVAVEAHVQQAFRFSMR
jgi:TonB family protein